MTVLPGGWVPASAQKIQTVWSLGMLVPTCRTTWYDDPEDHNVSTSLLHNCLTLESLLTPSVQELALNN